MLGYPENGPLRRAPARLGDTRTVLSEDSYGRGPFQRRIAFLRGSVRSGNSGGPIVDSAGRVLATVFAATASAPAGRIRVPDEVVQRGPRRHLVAGRHRAVHGLERQEVHSRNSEQPLARGGAAPPSGHPHGPAAASSPSIAFIFGAIAGVPGSPEKESAGRFVEAWARKDFARCTGS